MWLPDKGMLAAGMFDKHSLFIVQAWHEALSYRTTDTFRARAFDVYLLLEELDRIVEIARHDERWFSHVLAICEEIEAEKDDFLNLLGNTPAAISALHAITATSARADLGLLSERVRIIRTIVGSFQDRIIQDAMSLAADEKRKADLLHRIGVIATHIQKQGLADESLAMINSTLITLPPQDVLARLCAPLSYGPKVFKCVIAIKSNKSANIYNSPKFNLANSGWFKKSKVAGKWRTKHPKRTYVAIEVETVSTRLAAEHALAEINALMNLVVLYSNSSRPHISASILVECGPNTTVVEVTPSKHFGLLPRNNYIKIAQSRFEHMPEKVRGRMGNILEAYALAMSSEEPRTAIINLWIAMEAITGGNGNSNVGERVQSTIAPVLVWRRTDKVLTYLSINLNDLMTRLGIQPDASLMPSSHSKKVDKSDLLACLSGPRDNPGIKKLFQQTESSPLLRYRLYAAWLEYSEPKKMRRTLNQSLKRAQWQLLRIYRARNLLVHKGERNDYVWRLLENAQYYVSTVLGRILHDLADHHDWSIETSLESYRQKHSQLLVRLEKRNGDDLAFADLFMYAADTTPLWGDRSRFSTTTCDTT